MAYSDFKTIEDVQDKFHITVSSTHSFFTNLEAMQPSRLLQQTLAEYVPIAQNMNTEKARSELIITPILVEIHKMFARQVSFFSGADFTADVVLGLNGDYDYILTGSPNQIFITAPVICMIKAENENLKSAYGQCLAGMIAAQQFNQAEMLPAEHLLTTTIWGAATTGTAWRFLCLKGIEAFIDYDEYQINQVAKIWGIFRHILKISASS